MPSFPSDNHCPKFIEIYTQIEGFPSDSGVKNPPAMQEICWFDNWVGKISWRKKWQSTHVFLLGKSQGQRSLVNYGPWGDKELDTAEATEHTQVGFYAPCM